VIADKGYDSDQILNFIQEQGGVAVIPPKSNRKALREYDRELHKHRNLIERAFNKLKHWCRIATRYDRKSIYFLTALHIASAITWSV
jgi:transposase